MIFEQCNFKLYFIHVFMFWRFNHKQSTAFSQLSATIGTGENAGEKWGWWIKEGEIKHKILIFKLL